MSEIQLSSIMQARRGWLIAAAVLIVASIGALTLNAAPKTDESPCVAESEIPGLNGDAGVSVTAIPNYEKTMFTLFQARKFKQIDCIADSARSNKALFAGGLWKLRALYAGITSPNKDFATDRDWDEYYKLAKAWVRSKPQSITARVVLAEAYYHYGTQARGSGTSDTVSETGWKLFAEGNAKAEATLEQASTKAGKDPEWFALMQDISLGQEWDQDKKKELLEQAIEFEPGYYYYYRNYAQSLLPQWGGEDGEAASFLQGAADRVGGDAGDLLYFRVAGTLICGCPNYDENLALSWPRIEKGFAAVEKQYGPSIENSNQMAKMGFSFQDARVAQPLFELIGDQWSNGAWKNAAQFQNAREWAKEH